MLIVLLLCAFCSAFKNTLYFTELICTTNIITIKHTLHFGHCIRIIFLVYYTLNSTFAPSFSTLVIKFTSFEKSRLRGQIVKGSQ